MDRMELTRMQRQGAFRWTDRWDPEGGKDVVCLWCEAYKYECQCITCECCDLDITHGPRIGRMGELYCSPRCALANTAEERRDAMLASHDRAFGEVELPEQAGMELDGDVLRRILSRIGGAL